MLEVPVVLLVVVLVVQIYLVVLVVVVLERVELEGERRMTMALVESEQTSVDEEGP